MCGIAGIVSLSGRPIRDAERRIALMASLLHHRGPDRQGVYLSANGLAALANTRLAIVDVDNKFEVPMVSADGVAVLTFNGEIYNFTEERERLTGRGVTFRTRSDTEVLLEGLRCEGEAFLDRLDGFWGFGYYDLETQQLLLSRDLMGERHIFYCTDEHELMFASEMNPLLAARRGPHEIDVEGMVSSFRFRVPPPGRTLVKNVHRLLPGYNLLAQTRDGRVATRRHRRLHVEKWFDFFASQPSEERVTRVYEDALYQACRSRVPREVAFMATLSGGLDSALVTCYASAFGRRRVQTLYGCSTTVPPQRGDDLDELAASRLTSRRLGTAHHVFSMLDDDCLDLYRDEAANSFDGLFCEGVVAYWQLAQQVAARQGRVLLLSDGPDELIGGYDKDISAYRLFEHLSTRPIQRTILKGLSQIPWGRRVLSRNGTDLVNWSFVSRSPFRFRPIHGGTTPEAMSRLFEPQDVASSLWHYGTIHPDYADVVPHLDLSQCMALSYATGSLPDYFNLRSDRGTMRSSIEARLPMQTPQLAELMIATPAAWRFSGGTWTKFILRRLVDRHLGKEIAFRGKYGFAVPAWRQPRLSKLLGWEAVIAESAVFDDLPFRKGAREFFLQPGNERTRWFAYCLAMTAQRLKAQDVTIGTAPAASGVVRRPTASITPRTGTEIGSRSARA